MLVTLKDTACRRPEVAIIGRVALESMSTTASLSGWGRTAPTLAQVTVPRTPDDVAVAIAAAGPRGR